MHLLGEKYKVWTCTKPACHVLQPGGSYAPPISVFLDNSPTSKRRPSLHGIDNTWVLRCAAMVVAPECLGPLT